MVLEKKWTENYRLQLQINFHTQYVLNFLDKWDLILFNVNSLTTMNSEPEHPNMTSLVWIAPISCA